MAEDTSGAEPKRPKANGTSPRYFYLVSRKSSQPSVQAPEAGSASEREAIRGEDTIKSHHRETSTASREGSDTTIPDTRVSIDKVSARRGNSLRAPENKQLSLPDPESPTRRSKTATITNPTDISPIESPSHIPRGSGPSAHLPRQPFRRQCSLKIPTDPEMADQVDHKPASNSSVARQHGNRSGNFRPESEALYSKEDSYVRIDETPTRSADERGSVDGQPAPKVNGQIQRDSIYMSDLESSLHGDNYQKDQDDDDSYPDLDDMSIDDIYRPPPRSPNGGIRWAPWNVPFKRRGQTFVVLMHSLSLVVTVSLFFGFCANPFAWPLLLIYLLHVLSSKAATDGSLRYRSEWIRRSSIWHFFADYYPAKLHKTHELPATRKYIFGYHPHGIISHGAWAAFATDALGFSKKFPGITNSLLTLDSNFRIPFYREYILSMGMRSVSKDSIANILNKGGPNGEGMGRGVTIVVGGARESLEARPGKMRLILRERKGFIKLAVRCGADLVPVLAFGENDLYDQLQPQEHPFLHSIQMFILKVWKFTLPFLHGRGIFNYDAGLMPYRRPLNIVVGAPIKVRQSSSVDLEEINRLHSLYVAELEKLWDRYKDEFAPDRTEEMQILP